LKQKLEHLQFGSTICSKAVVQFALQWLDPQGHSSKNRAYHTKVMLSVVQLEVVLLLNTAKQSAHYVLLSILRGTNKAHLIHTNPLKKKINISLIQISSPYRAVNTQRLGYKNQPVNVV